jgi:hypothetical protein
MLAVVEDEQGALVADCTNQELTCRRIRTLGDMKRVGCLLREQLAVGERREVHPTHSAEGACHAQDRLPRKASLAAPAGPGKGEETG